MYQERESSKEEQRLDKLYNSATNAHNWKKYRKHKKECEEFFYADVDNTLTQFTTEQKKEIQQTYNIPISSKFAFAIIEQYLAILTSSKPYPQIVSSGSDEVNFADTYSKAFHAVWYESKGNHQLQETLKDSLNTGLGYIVISKSSFFDNSSTSVNLKHWKWSQVFMDPESRDANGDDAEFCILVDYMRKRKAEKILGREISDKEIVKSSDFGLIQPVSLPDNSRNYFMDASEGYVWQRWFYELEEVNLYISMGGEVSNTKPKKIEIPNPQLKEITAEIKAMQAERETMQQDKGEMQQDVQELEDMPPTLDDEEQAAISMSEDAARNEVSQYDEVFAEIDDRIKELKKIKAQMPAMVTRYKMKTLGGDTIIIKEYMREEQKRVKLTEMIGDEIVSDTVLPCDRIPVIQFPFVFNHSPVVSYGEVHFIMDLVKAMDKYVADVMLEIALNGRRKAFVWENTVIDPKKMESDWSRPGALISLRPDPSLPEGGKPILVDPSALNSSIQYMLSFFRDMIEYITGLYGVMQGDVSQAPETYGATQSLQNFGSQRVKMYARYLESSLENLAYVTVQYLQAYCPKETVIKYFDENGDGQELEVMSDSQDYDFKVRVEMSSSLPTERQQIIQKLGFLAQTFKDDRIQARFAEYLLDMSGLPEAKKMAKDIDMIQQMTQQIQQLEEELKKKDATIESAQHNLQQQKQKEGIDHAVQSAEKDIAVERERQMASMQGEEEEQLPEEALFKF